MAAIRIESQDEHDERHPGMYCRACPDVIAYVEELRDEAAALRARCNASWWKRWLR